MIIAQEERKFFQFNRHTYSYGGFLFFGGMWWLLTGCVLIWGSSFMLMKLGLEVFTPLEVGALRMTIAGLVLMPVAVRLVLRRGMRNYPFRRLGVASLLGNLLPALFFPLGQTALDSGTTGILNSLTPLFTLVLGVVLFGQRSVTRHWFGVGLGLVGAIGLTWLQSTFTPTKAMGYAGFIVLGTICYGLNINYMRRYLQHVPAQDIAVLTLGLAAIPSIFFLTIFPPTAFYGTNFGTSFWQALGAVIVLAVAGSAVAQGLFFALIQRGGGVFAASVTYLMPVMALGWGIVLGETITWGHGLALLVIAGGVWLCRPATKP